MKCGASTSSPSNVGWQGAGTCSMMPHRVCGIGTYIYGSYTRCCCQPFPVAVGVCLLLCLLAAAHWLVPAAKCCGLLHASFEQPWLGLLHGGVQWSQPCIIQTAQICSLWPCLFGFPRLCLFWSLCLLMLRPGLPWRCCCLRLVPVGRCSLPCCSSVP